MNIERLEPAHKAIRVCGEGARRKQGQRLGDVDAMSTAKRRTGREVVGTALDPRAKDCDELLVERLRRRKGLCHPRVRMQAP